MLRHLKFVTFISWLFFVSSAHAQYDKGMVLLDKAYISDAVAAFEAVFNLGRYAFLVDHFSMGDVSTNQIGFLKWQQTSVGAASGYSSSYGTDAVDYDGIFVVGSGTAANTGRVVFSRQQYAYDVAVMGRIAVNNVSGFVLHIGFSNSATDSAGNVDIGTYGAYIYYAPDVSPNIIGVCENGNNRTTVDLGVNPGGSNVWFNYKIVIEGSSRALFYINGALRGSITTNLPGMNLVFFVHRIVTTNTVSKNMKISDFAEIFYNYTKGMR